MEKGYERKPIKVIHVHFLNGMKNYYFGSVRAIFKKFTADDIGFCEQDIRQQLPEDGSPIINNKVMIVRSRLIR